MHLVGLGEVVQRLRRGVAEFFHRSVQIGQGITDGNQTGTRALSLTAGMAGRRKCGV